MKVYVKVFGCKVNQYEASRLKVGFGTDLTSDPEQADEVVVIGCVVTHRAEAEVRQFVKKWLGRGKRVILTGCGTKIALKDLAGTGALLVNPEEMESFFVNREVPVPSEVPFMPERSRGFLKVQEGCDWGCTYCLSWLERGKPRSRSLSAILSEMNALHGSGIWEVVLTGTNLMLWRQDEVTDAAGVDGEDTDTGAARRDYLEMLAAVGYHAAGLGMRVRLSSVYPDMLDADMVDLLLSMPFAHHLHLSLQSASSRVLRTMKRSQLYVLERSLSDLRRADRFFGLTADVIVGFPTETEQDLLFTMSFLREYGFAKVHVFPFSGRPGTAAARLKLLRPRLVKARAKLLEECNGLMKDEFVRKQLGAERPAIFVWGQDAALTDNYVYVPSTPFQGIKPIVISKQAYIT